MNRRLKISIVAVFLCLGLAQVIPAVLNAATDTTGDLGRHWVVTRYILNRVDPYPVAFAALRERYGLVAPAGPVHMKDTKIFTVPKTGPHPETDATLGVPEAVYPPMAIMMLLPLGLLPVELIRGLWLLVNLAFLFLVAYELYVLTGTGALHWFLILGLVATWPASAYCIEREQFSLFALWCILAARRMEQAHPVLAGLLYSISLLKPGLAVPFLLLPLLERRVTVLASLVSLQVALLAAMSWLVQVNPIHLLREWLGVASYFRQGMYTLQDIINGLRLDGSLLDVVLQITVLLAATFVSIKLTFQKRLAFLAVISCVWNYHALYDFVAMLVAIALMTKAKMDRRWMLNAAALCLVAIGLTMPIYHGSNSTARGMRWATRVSLVILVVTVHRTAFLATAPGNKFSLQPVVI